MFINFLLGGVIFGYAAWVLYRYIKKSKQGKCAGCALEKKCKQKK